MKQEEKELLLKDLSARLPYGVKCNVSGVQQSITLTAIDVFSDYPYKFGVVQFSCTTNVKPYLRPMSSMTEEEKKELGDTIIKLELEHLEYEEGFNVKASKSSTFEIDFYNSHHIDYRGLIGMDLALKAETSTYDF